MTQHRVTLDSKHGFLLTYPYCPKTNAEVKSIGGWWNSSRRAFAVPKYKAKLLAPLLQQYSFELDEATKAEIAAFVEPQSRPHGVPTQTTLTLPDPVVVPTHNTLMPFQAAGVKQLVKWQSGFLADEPGLGKTTQSLHAMVALNAFPLLILCPASLKLNWAREVRTWFNRPSQILEGEQAQVITEQIVIANFDIVCVPQPAPEPPPAHLNARQRKQWIAKHKPPVEILPHFLTAGFTGLICDEAHYLKSGDAKRTKAVAMLANTIPHKLLLSGTPAKSRPNELIEPLKILGVFESIFGSWVQYVTRYCAAERTKFGWNIQGASHLSELHERLTATCMVRRTKEEVLPQLPSKTHAVELIAITNRKEYTQAEQDIAGWMRDHAHSDPRFLTELEDMTAEEREEATKVHVDRRVSVARRAAAFVKLATLKRLAARGKMAAVIEWVHDFLESGEKLLLFAHHHEFVEELVRIFHCPAVFGKTTHKQENVDQFQEGSATLLVCNLQTGGVGFNIDSCSHVAFLEYPWGPSELSQCVDRIHRMTQKKQIVAHYFVAERTIDEAILRTIESKRKVVDVIHDGATEDKSALISMLEYLQKKGV